MMIKTRVLPENNYRAVYHDGITLRFALDKSKPITELFFPEFYDVKLTNRCLSGGRSSGSLGCLYCYQDSIKDGNHGENILDKIDFFFGNMAENERPFQIAYGGGEPTLHPDFVKVLEKSYSLGIVPNYTTNGMHVTDKLVEATKKYCGGVAVSCHPHLQSYWQKAINKYVEAEVMVNLHHIIWSRESIDYFETIYDKYKNVISYFVLLPYIAQGRAEEISGIEYDYLRRKIERMDRSKLAFGAKFYDWIVRNNGWLDVSLYSPEAFSKYLDLTGDEIKLYRSSFDLEEEVQLG